MSQSLTVAHAGSVAYTGAFVMGNVLSVRRGYPGEPLGIRTGQPVGRDVALGFGAALAAPWPMLVALWVVLTRARRPGRVGRRSLAGLALLSSLFLAGSAAEPVSHRVLTRELPPLDATVAVANLVLPIVIMGGALSSLAET
jgi:hypothetical protein